ncbi:MAG: UpxY family transcription antiterminator [Thermogutta sp.]|uniref:transcription termination/antitermination protein NusG n=1 Tax=Thermogutta sp. TaxID=1962930 RepID=UPI0019BD6EBB|nr:transcription termination/antitermination NusG family protein [Thermogutta sp.]MBC7354417.1 UpxY family transcription antiterminator [Thermogutta sp.]
MPIRPKEPDIFPENLLDEGHSLAVEGRWWALYTKARQEKILMQRLRELRIAHYCPLVPKRTKTPKGRIFTSYIPLFSGYVFLCGQDEDRYRAVTTNCVSKCIEVPDKETLVSELRSIKRVIASGLPLLPESRITTGTRVRIRSGPLAGIEGVVVSRHGEERFIVMVSFIQQGASLLADLVELEPIANEC